MQTRTQVAEDIALRAVMFVYRAKRDGYTNRLTTTTLWEAVELGGYRAEQFSMKTAKRAAQKMGVEMGISDRIDF